MRILPIHMKSLIAPWLVLAVGLGCLAAGCSGANTRATDAQSTEAASTEPGEAGDAQEPTYGTVQRVAELEYMPSGLAIWGDRVFLSQPRWGQVAADGVDAIVVDATVVELVGGEVVPYPNVAINDGSDVTNLQSVNGLHIDTRGRLWMLDNGRVDLAPGQLGAPKLIVWDVDDDTEAFRVAFDETIAPAQTSFLNDLVVDAPRGFAYITETGLGGTPALVVYDFLRDEAWRVLEGVAGTAAEPIAMRIEDQDVMLNGSPWQVGANAIAMSSDGDTLFFGPMTGRTLHQIDTAALRDPTLPRGQREAAVQIAGPKPITDGIANDPTGRLYFTDVERGALSGWSDAGELQVIAEFGAGSFPVAIEAVGDGWVYVTTNQLHRMPLFHAGTDHREPPYALWRVWVGVD